MEGQMFLLKRLQVLIILPSIFLVEPIDLSLGADLLAWREAKWGMTRTELKSAFVGKEMISDSKLTMNALSIDRLQIKDINYIVTFKFNDKEHLDEIHFSPNNDVSIASMFDFISDIEKKYGRMKNTSDIQNQLSTHHIFYWENGLNKITLDAEESNAFKGRVWVHLDYRPGLNYDNNDF
jgi:hypothetical protein